MTQALGGASLLLGALVLALAGPSTPPQPSACPHPHEAASRSGGGGHGDAADDWTGVVGCAAGGEGAGALRGPARLLFGQRLDLNCADPAALESLPGIGPARAGAIALARCQRPFARVADLERVRGLGPATVGGLARWVEVSQTSVTSGICPRSCGSVRGRRRGD
ncbi:MAG: helix-hairpin-helix domain-containing protein [Proteobacteria bacterium]|nr:helix-hairpin-helix domain-containing protein [Pseudomonadota bacterium]MCZ6783572.1 helix-hairpin-helix domain-containing protein [Pseudomonadota bacterium]